ncbi:MAG TPA: hypothetical protein VFL99_05340 [Segeticoccus sp.]|uniref:hypothetical protein n=1 Tax=Segeticoccus sp. TaxID=2706531 RepID=UPI002D807092|nr:hypothetical protein [Segeticoccus sp.]HET8599731.1 hypothetical protein [Segeticoccus sp.]
MELTEAIRRIVAGRWAILVGCFVIAVGGTLAVTLLASPLYTSTARMQATTTPPGSDSEADSILNQVQGVATSPRVISLALQDAKLSGHRDPTNVATNVQVTRIGTSAVFDVSVQDPDRADAKALTEAVTQQAIDFLNTSGAARTSQLDDNLHQQLDQLITQRQHRYDQLAKASSGAPRAQLTAEIGSLDQEISDVNTAIRQLGLTTVTASNASLVSDAGSAVPVAQHLTTHLALAAIAGIVAGFLICILLEVGRPRVADGRALARELDAPVLGDMHRQSVDATTALAIASAARRRRLSTVVLAGTTPSRLRALAAHLDPQLEPTQTVPTAAELAGSPSSNGHSNNRHGGAAAADRWRTGADITPGTVHVANPPMVTVSDLSARVEAIPLADLGSRPRQACGLLIVVPRLSRYSEIRRLTDLAAATGWPVLGVLDDRTSSHRKGS